VHEHPSLFGLGSLLDEIICMVGQWFVGALALLAHMWRHDQIFVIIFLLGDEVIPSSWSWLSFG
jgi:hypothetical protein